VLTVKELGCLFRSARQDDARRISRVARVEAIARSLIDKLECVRGIRDNYQAHQRPQPKVGQAGAWMGQASSGELLFPPGMRAGFQTAPRQWSVPESQRRQQAWKEAQSLASIAFACLSSNLNSTLISCSLARLHP